MGKTIKEENQLLYDRLIGLQEEGTAYLKIKESEYVSALIITTGEIIDSNLLKAITNEFDGVYVNQYGELVIYR